MDDLPAKTPETEEEPPLWRQVSGIMGMISGAGAWLSLLGAGAFWVLAACFVAFGLFMAEGSFLTSVLPHAPPSRNCFEGLITGILFGAMALILIVIIGAVVMVGSIGSSLVAGGFHLVGLITSVGTIVAPGNHWAARVAGIPPLMLHGTGVAVVGSAVLFVVVAIVNEEMKEPPPPPPPIEFAPEPSPEPASEPVEEPAEPEELAPLSP